MTKNDAAAVLAGYANRAELPITEAARLGDLLGIEDSAVLSDLELARRVGGGLDPDAATVLTEILGRANVVGPVIPEATLRRARNEGKPLSREMSERLYELSRIVEALSRSYRGDREGIMAYLTASHPLLEGQRALDVACSSSAGARHVLELIHRAQYGFPV